VPRHLILVLVQQVLNSLLVDLDLNLVLLFQVLQLSLLVAQLSFLVFYLLLLDDPEVVELLALLLELIEVAVFLDSLLEDAVCFLAQRLLRSVMQRACITGACE
jgi:hypothetical protein